MANSFWTHGNPFAFGTLIRADTMNEKLEGIAEGFDLVSQAIGFYCEFPDTFEGSLKVPDKTLRSTLLWLNPQGNADAYPMRKLKPLVDEAKADSAEFTAWYPQTQAWYPQIQAWHTEIGPLFNQLPAIQAEFDEYIADTETFYGQAVDLFQSASLALTDMDAAISATEELFVPMGVMHTDTGARNTAVESLNTEIDATSDTVAATYLEIMAIKDALAITVADALVALAEGSRGLMPDENGNVTITGNVTTGDLHVTGQATIDDDVWANSKINNRTLETYVNDTDEQYLTVV